MGIEEKIISSEIVFKGIFLNMERVLVELPDGNKSERDVIRHPGAVAVLAINDKGDILMEKQYRVSLDKVILEIPAGKIDKGENPDEAALRELKEETGFSAKKIVRAGEIALAAGYSDEVIIVYIAEDIESGETSMDEDEFLEFEFIPQEKVLEMIKSGEIIDSKTICAMTYLNLRNKGF